MISVAEHIKRLYAFYAAAFLHKYFKSRASVAGLQLTYIMVPFESRNASSSDCVLQPFLGGSRIITSNLRLIFYSIKQCPYCEVRHYEFHLIEELLLLFNCFFIFFYRNNFFGSITYAYSKGCYASVGIEYCRVFEIFFNIFFT